VFRPDLVPNVAPNPEHGFDNMVTAAGSETLLSSGKHLLDVWAS